MNVELVLGVELYGFDICGLLMLKDIYGLVLRVTYLIVQLDVFI